MPHTKEIFSDHLMFMLDTDENRSILEYILGKPELIYNNRSYIQINLNEKIWRTSLDFEWLYRNKPPLSTIVDLIGTLKQLDKAKDTNQFTSLEESENNAICFTKNRMNIVGELLSEDYKIGYKEGIEHYLAHINHL